MERAIQIDCDFPLPNLAIDLIKRFAARKARIVDQHIGCAAGFDEIVDGVMDFSPVSQIENKPICERQWLHGNEMLIGAGDNRSRSVKSCDERPSDPATGTRNEDMFVFETKEIVES